MKTLLLQWRRGVVLALLCMWLPLVAWAADEVAVPPLQARVTDLTGTLSAEQQAALSASLQAFEQRKGSQVAVLLVPTTQPETIEQYSIRVAETWKLGRKGIDDGVLLLVAKNDRTVRIEVGYGLEGPLPDAVANRIVREVIVPRFREGDFYLGLVEGVDRIIKVIDGEPLPEPERRNESAESNIGRVLPILFFGIVIGSSVLRALFGRLGAAAATSAGVGLVVWLVLSTLIGALIAALFAFIFVIGSGGGRGGWTHGSRGWGGGFGGMGSGSSWGGGGGFGGGGGGFGGGGASGRW